VRTARHGTARRGAVHSVPRTCVISIMNSALCRASRRAATAQSASDIHTVRVTTTRRGFIAAATVRAPVSRVSRDHTQRTRGWVSVSLLLFHPRVRARARGVCRRRGRNVKQPCRTISIEPRRPPVERHFGRHSSSKLPSDGRQRPPGVAVVVVVIMRCR